MVLLKTHHCSDHLQSCIQHLHFKSNISTAPSARYVLVRYSMFTYDKQVNMVTLLYLIHCLLLQN